MEEKAKEYLDLWEGLWEKTLTFPGFFPLVSVPEFQSAFQSGPLGEMEEEGQEEERQEVAGEC